MSVLLQTLVLAVIWLVSGYSMTAAIGLSTPWPIICGVANVITGLLLLQIITRSPKGWKLFYYGPENDEEGYLPVGLLYALPLGLLGWAIIIWFVRWLFGLSSRQ